MAVGDIGFIFHMQFIQSRRNSENDRGSGNSALAFFSTVSYERDFFDQAIVRSDVKKLTMDNVLKVFTMGID